MKSLINYIIKEQGYEWFKGSKNGEFSTMSNIDVTYKKEDSFINFGLHEYKKPPTLISPRPSIKVYGEFEVETINGETLKLNCINEQSDTAMNRVLQTFTPKQIYKAMFDKSITLTINDK